MSFGQLTSDALDAFWNVIVKRFPQAITGDLSPVTTFQLGRAAEAAIEEWVRYNVTTQEIDIVAGYRFRLLRPVDRFSHFVTPVDLTGIITSVDLNGIWAQMDQHMVEAEYWDNQIHWHSPEEFARDTMPA